MKRRITTHIEFGGGRHPQLWTNVLFPPSEDGSSHSTTYTLSQLKVTVVGRQGVLYAHFGVDYNKEVFKPTVEDDVRAKLLPLVDLGDGLIIGAEERDLTVTFDFDSPAEPACVASVSRVKRFGELLGIELRRLMDFDIWQTTEVWVDGKWIPYSEYVRYQCFSSSFCPWDR